MSPLAVLAQSEGLNTGGMIVMVGCIGCVIGLMVYCYYRVLREPRPSKHHHAPLDIDTHDLNS